MFPDCLYPFISCFAQGHDNDDENEIAWIDPSSGTTFLVDRRTGHSYPRTPLSRESDEDNTQAISFTRRTIAFADTGDRCGEPPQWIRDALKVSTAHVGLRLETYKVS